jgi:uncharacterized protein YydD (DUF2326 family)
VSPNTLGHLEFKSEILDGSGNATSADLGHTYRKLLYHDGVFESLDDRKKENLLAVLREYAGLGIQPVITLIDSDLPPRNDGSQVFDESEIVVTLHDENDQGRLFRMRSW